MFSSVFAFSFISYKHSDTNSFFLCRFLAFYVFRYNKNIYVLFCFYFFIHLLQTFWYKQFFFSNRMVKVLQENHVYSEVL